MIIMKNGERFIVATYNDGSAVLMRCSDPPYELWLHWCFQELSA